MWKIRYSITICLFWGLLWQKGITQPSIYLLQTNQFDSLDTWLSNNEIDDCFKGYNLLTLAIRIRNSDLVKYLIQKQANVNAFCGSYNPLIQATLINQFGIIKELVEHGANPLLTNEHGKNSIQFAIEKNFYESFYYLVKDNPEEYLSDDLVKMAFRARDSRFIQFLVTHNLITITESMLDIDGPYLFHDSTNLITNYQIGPLDHQIVPKVTSHPTSSSFTCYINELDSFSFPLHDVKAPKAIYPKVQNLLVISDIEGHWEPFIGLLKGNKVINDNYEWIYGKGHLVLLGDFFDRGDMVTQILWLIYKLDHEAAQAGGMVHFIIGNHEEMNLRGDIRYVHPKYMINSRFLEMSPTNMIGPNTILGQWLRSKNMVEKIGSLLFVHGGISPSVVEANFNIHEINELGRKYYGHQLDTLTDFRGQFLFSQEGPMWYRGYFYDSTITKPALDTIVQHFGVRTIIVGHTPVEKIHYKFEKKLIAIDVPHARGADSSRGLYIHKGRHLYSTNKDGHLLELE